MKAADESIPKMSPYKYRFPFNAEIKTLIKYRNFYRNQFKQYNRPWDKSSMSQLNRLIKKTIARISQDKFNERLSTLLVQDNSVWTMTKALKNKKSIVPPLKTTSDNLAYSEQNKANVLGSSFHHSHLLTANMNSSHEPEVANSLEKIRNTSFQPNSGACSHCKADTVKRLIDSLNPKKAPGPDLISNGLLKKCPEILHKILSNIFNKCLDFSCFPTKWKEARVVAIAKPGKPPDDPSSYRPFSLISKSSKNFFLNVSLTTRNPIKLSSKSNSVSLRNMERSSKFFVLHKKLPLTSTKTKAQA